MSNKSNPVARAGNTELRDGSRHPGLQTPAFREGDLGTLQPHIFVANHGVQFWGGMFGVAAEERRALYTRWGKGPTRFFRCGSARIPPYRQVSWPATLTDSIDLVGRTFKLNIGYTPALPLVGDYRIVPPSLCELNHLSRMARVLRWRHR